MTRKVFILLSTLLIVFASMPAFAFAETCNDEICLLKAAEISTNVFIGAVLAIGLFLIAIWVIVDLEMRKKEKIVLWVKKDE